jgi:hypothetical protein
MTPHEGTSRACAGRTERERGGGGGEREWLGAGNGKSSFGQRSAGGVRTVGGWRSAAAALSLWVASPPERAD